MRPRASEPTFVDALVRDKRVIVCCGAGGVGKTTTAAALAMAGAKSGRKTLVLTIDPARRLAEAMSLSAERSVRPTIVPAERLRDAGLNGAGELSAWMLSPVDLVEQVVRDLSPSEASASRVLSNRLYRHFSEMVIGLQEYTAGEALHRVTTTRAYDLVVLDTPPSRNALSFLDAPRKLTLLLDEKVIGLLMPRKGAHVWDQMVKLMQKVFTAVFGQAFFGDLQEFVGAISHMFHEVRRHAEEVRALLQSSDAAFLLVTSADPSALEEAAFFREQIRTLALPFGGTVLNRSWAFTRGLGHPKELPLVDPTPAERSAREKLSALADGEWKLAMRDRALLSELKKDAPGAAALAAPHIGEAIESLEGLLRLAQNLTCPSAGAWERDSGPC